MRNEFTRCLCVLYAKNLKTEILNLESLNLELKIDVVNL